MSLCTLEELQNVTLQNHSCYKKEFGCERGCRDYCYAKSSNTNESELKQNLIKLWKECFENNN